MIKTSTALFLPLWFSWAKPLILTLCQYQYLRVNWMRYVIFFIVSNEKSSYKLKQWGQERLPLVFLKFMDKYNGRTAIPEDDWCSLDEIMYPTPHWCSSVVGWVAVVYDLQGILVCLSVWGSLKPNMRILMQWDNLSWVLLLDTGRCKHKLMICIAQNIWQICDLCGT